MSEHGFERPEAGDLRDPRAHTDSRPYSPADPRSSPPLSVVRGSKLLIAPRSHSPTVISQGHNTNHYFRTCDNYTLGSNNADSSDRDRRLAELLQDDEEGDDGDGDDDMVQGMKALGLGAGLGINPGTNDSKDIPRLYAGSSSSLLTTSLSSGQAILRPKSPNNAVRDPAKLCPPRGVVPSQTPLHNKRKSATRHDEEESIGHTRWVLPTDGLPRIALGSCQPVAGGAALDDDITLCTTSRQPSGSTNICPTQEKNHDAIQDAQPGCSLITASSIGQKSILDKTKGIGDWANDESCCRGLTDLPGAISPNSPRYQKILDLEAVVQCANGNSEASGSNSNARPSPKSPGGQKSGGGRRGNPPKRNTSKRKKENGNGSEGDEGGSDDNCNNTKRSKHTPCQSSPDKWFACHFHKHDPTQFSTNGSTGKRYKCCDSGGWPDIPRVKEHIYRNHNEDIHDVREELRKRPKRGTSPEERWYKIWDLLFPDEDCPNSPYCDQEDSEIDCDLDELRRSLERSMNSALGGMSCHEAQKTALINVAVEHVKLTLQQALGKLQNKDCFGPCPIPNDGKSAESTIKVPTVQYPPLEPEHSSSLFGNDNFSTAYPGFDGNHQLLHSGQSFNCPGLFLNQPGIEISSSARPTTPTQYTSSSAHDSAYFSNEPPLYDNQGASYDMHYTNPPYSATPTPNMRPPQRNFGYPPRVPPMADLENLDSFVADGSLFRDTNGNYFSTSGFNP